LGKKESVAEKGKRILAEREKEKEKIRREFNIDDFVRDADETREVEVKWGGETLVIKYKSLRNKDNFELAKIEDEQKRNIKTLFVMMNRADPNITEEKIENLNPILTQRILAEISRRELSFLT